jgi:MFS family permease
MPLMTKLSGVIYLLVGIASLGGVLFGYETGVAAGALHLASNAWDLDGRYLVLLSTGTLIGALVGALLSGKLADLIGRRDVIMATAALFTLGAFVSAIAPSIYVLLLGRFIVGIAVGAISVAAPLYIAEISPAAKRGRLVCCFQLAITTGILFAYLGNEIFSSWTNGWRYVLAMGAIPGILLSGLALLLLESPLWLALQGDDDEARATLAKLRFHRVFCRRHRPNRMGHRVGSLSAAYSRLGDEHCGRVALALRRPGIARHPDPDERAWEISDFRPL